MKKVRIMALWVNKIISDYLVARAINKFFVVKIKTLLITRSLEVK